MGGKRCSDVSQSVILGFILFAVRGQCDYVVNGKLTSGNTIGDTNYHHILVEEADHSRAPRPGLPWIWPGGDSGGHVVQTAGRSCYDLRRTSERIDSRYIRRVLRTRNRRECELECDRDALCKGFNYRFKTQGFNQYRDNCQLSHQDGNSNFDFHKDLDFDFYQKEYDSRRCYVSESLTVEATKNESRNQGDYWNNHGGDYWNNQGDYWNNQGDYWNNQGGDYWNSNGGREECFRLVAKQRAISEREAAGSLMARDIRECRLVCEQSWQFTCKVFSFSYYTNSARHNCLMSNREYRDLPVYSLVQDTGSQLYERRLYDRECGLDTGGNYYPGNGRMMTVQGLRCHREPCRLDRLAGYFFCETDFSGAWDFCCRPGEQCGYSEGHPLPWCYVGSYGHDKWRPCNEDGRRRRDFLKSRAPPLGVALNISATTTETSTTEYPAVNTEQPVEVFDMF